MRSFWQIGLCCILAAGTALAQRGGGYGGGRRGGVGAGFMGGGGNIGGFRSGSGFNGGFGGHGFFGTIDVRRSITQPGFTFLPFGFRHFDGRFGGNFYNRGFNTGYYGGFGYLPWGGDSSFYWPNYANSSYAPGYDFAYQSGYAAYQPSPNVTVIYPMEPVVPPLSAERAHPVTREYDQNGQEIRPPGSPLYLIAFKDHTIRAATSYRVDGTTLHYTTPENENKEASLDTVDRGLSMQLNRERNLSFQLPPQ